MKYRVLEVDLSKNKCVKKILPDSFVRQWAGGRGAAAALLKDANVAKANVFSEQTVVVITTGGFCGVLPGADRVWVSCFSPLTGLYSSASAAGQYALALRRSGFDAIRIRGKAGHPVRLLLSEGKAEILPAKDLWGSTVSKTMQAMANQSAGSKTLCVGPAGENLVAFAAASADGVLCMRGGAGAVLGYKKLKAITCVGSVAIAEASDDKIRGMTAEFFHEPVMKNDVSLLERLNDAGLLATDNWRKTRLEAAAAAFGELKAHDLDFEEAWAFTSCQGFADSAVAVSAATACLEYGLDYMTMAGTLAWARECAEKETAGIKAADLAALPELVSQTAHRHGVGNTLADGPVKASVVFGAACKDFAVHQFGAALSGFDCRLFPGMMLSYVFGHGDAWKAFTVPAELAMKPAERLSTKGKAKLAVELFDRTAALDSFGFSPLAGISPDLLKKAFAVFYKSKPDVMRIGNNVVLLERRLDVARGLTRKDDVLPARVFQEITASGKKVKIKPADFEALKREFYKLHGF